MCARPHRGARLSAGYERDATGGKDSAILHLFRRDRSDRYDRVGEGGRGDEYATCSGVVAYVMCLDCRTCLLANSVLYYNNVLYYEVVEDAMKTDEPSEEAEMAELADRAIRLIRSMTIIFILI